jgi:hypothetical protein
MTREWETYEEVATYLLNKFSSEFGLDRVEGQQKVQGKLSGTTWTIDYPFKMSRMENIDEHYSK